MSTTKLKSTEIIIEHLRKLEGCELKIAELVIVADRHAAVVREHLGSQGDVRPIGRPIGDLSTKLLAASLQDLVTEKFQSSEDSVVKQLAEIAIEQVDWHKVAESCGKPHADKNSMAA